MKCPAIPFTAAEVRREAYLWRLATAFQALMDEARNPCALKGGTALRFQAGLSRPSTDLDFEGDGPVSVRKTLMKAVAAATPADPYRIGRDLLWRGTVMVTLRDAEAGRVRIGVDYRKTGEELQSRLRGEQMTSRVSTTEVWQALEAGIRKLERRPDDPGSAEDYRPGAPPTRPVSAVRALK